MNDDFGMLCLEQCEEAGRPCEDVPRGRRTFLRSLAALTVPLVAPRLQAQDDCCECETSCENDPCISACQNCQVGCEVACQDGCEVDCQLPCDASCQDLCMMNCQNACILYCQTCQGGCQDYDMTC
jgi:hypothetical protein